MPDAPSLLFVHLGRMLVPVAVALASSGWQVKYLSHSIPTSLATRLEERYGISRLRLDLESDLQLPPKAYDSPSIAADAFARRPRVARLIDRLSEEFSTQIDPSDALRMALMKSLLERRNVSFQILCWTYTNAGRRRVLITNSPKDRVLLGEAAGEVSVLYLPPVLLNARRFGRLVAQALRRGAESVEGSAPEARDDIQAQSHLSRLDAQVLLLFNENDRYGSLYAYDHFFSDDPTSPLHRDRVGLISRRGGSLASGRVSDAFPTSGSRRSLAVATSARMLAAIAQGRAVMPWGVTWDLCRFVAAAPRTAAVIRKRYPEARVVCFIYDIQVPPTIAYAFELAGIRSIALQERLDATVEHHSPHIVNTSLCASDYFAALALTSYSSAVSATVPVGMWRTDLLLEARRTRGPRPLVVALPYRVDDHPLLHSDPVSMSSQAMDCFLESVRALARSQPGVDIVIRTKDVDWLRNASLRDAIRATRDVPNITIDEDYSSLNRSYDLCGQASLIIGHYTSLIDESLALGIPCIVHDFNRVARGIRLTTMEHYPSFVVAVDIHQVLERAERILASDGAEFSEKWEPTRLDLYGSLNDGSVRRRARAYVEAQLSSPDEAERSTQKQVPVRLEEGGTDPRSPAL